VTVDSPRGGRRDFWVYGSFPAETEVRIDGKTVFKRPMGHYGTGKRMRRVKLSPGVHRVRVKIAYDQGYRDSFDLAFLADEATPLSGSGVTFSRTAPSGYSSPGAGIGLRGEAMKPYDLEPLMVPTSGTEQADSSSLYLTALAAYFDQQPQYFEPAMAALMERHGDFAPAWGLKSLQVATRWEIPSDKRNGLALAHLRKAHALDDGSLRFTSRLAARLRQRNPESREVRDLLESARKMALGSDDELAALDPFNEWADWLESRGWRPMAEDAWRRALEVEPTNCTAANSLQDLLYTRGVYPELSAITESWKKCPGLERRQIRRDPKVSEYDKLALVRRQAKRSPFDASRQISYAHVLRRRGDSEKAHQVLKEARQRMPWSSALVAERANRIFAESGEQAAVDFMRSSFEERGGPGVWELRRLSTLTNQVPLSDLLVDGREVAMEHLSGEQSSVGQSDEAYYVIDYAASDYSENGVRRTLTHTMVRVMTKGAIDRFAETQVPGGAEIVRIRTIKEDGTTLVPERTAGKSTLSMPGLDEGDFVEVAYLTHQSESQPVRSTRQGMRFFFQMSDISSLRSQYTVLGAEDAQFMRNNDAPESEPVEAESGSGRTFVRRDSPRPRREPHRVRGTEYLPWIQMYREGTSVDFWKVHKWSARNQILKGHEISDAFRRQVAEWREDTEAGTVDEMRDLFYDVTAWFNDPSPQSLSTDVSHSLYTRSGSPVMMLHAAYRLAGIPSQVHLVKSFNQDPEVYPMGEFAKYRYAVLRVQQPDGTWRWVQPGHEDAMFGILGLLLHGQPAVCISCENPEAGAERVPDDSFPTSRREVHVESSLSASGTLNGTAEVTFNGIRAMTVRKTLTQVPEKAKRQKFMGRIMTGLIPGSSLEGYRILQEDEHDKPLTFELDFSRRQFARASDGALSVQTTLFRVPVASLYAKLQTRQTPLMIRGQRRADFRMTIRLPLGYSADITSRTGSWEFNSDFGSFSRTVEAGSEAITLRSSVHLPLQRVSTDVYGEFREFAISVERSSRFLVDLRGE
jgi:tetratricopeptide (TPR) repeat protein